MNNTPVLNPHLALLPAEWIAEQVPVYPVNFEARQKPFEMTYFEVGPGCESPLDQHAVAECWIILRGHGLLTYAGQSQEVNPEAILYFEPHQPHQIKNLAATPMLICSIYWHIQK
ncbi:MAG: hypothetical protein K0S11_934 [Gammaproteobacteria bacterium]|jgi:mannose-6-phosphate isomerase-like protein (cupin superfamily)|nr:hypothetical protein [Gammaproteobacteria bacterium]